jgi:hypothetical protein
MEHYQKSTLFRQAKDALIETGDESIASNINNTKNRAIKPG